jgi:hypothetical protein
MGADDVVCSSRCRLLTLRTFLKYEETLVRWWIWTTLLFFKYFLILAFVFEKMWADDVVCSNQWQCRLLNLTTYSEKRLKKHWSGDEYEQHNFFKYFPIQAFVFEYVIKWCRLLRWCRLVKSWVERVMHSLFIESCCKKSIERLCLINLTSAFLTIYRTIDKTLICLRGVDRTAADEFSRMNWWNQLLGCLPILVLGIWTVSLIPWLVEWGKLPPWLHSSFGRPVVW